MRKKGYIELPNFLSHEVFCQLKGTVEALKDQLSIRNFSMPKYETPRKLLTLGGSTIKQNSPSLRKLYTNSSILNFIKQVVQEEVFFCQHPEEWMVINYLNEQGSTHGWHLDDPEFALILLLEINGEGGNVEIINYYMNKLQSSCSRDEIIHNIPAIVEKGRQERAVFSKQIQSGTAYLLRGGQCLHRVSELTAPHYSRLALNMAFENTPSPTYGETAYFL